MWKGNIGIFTANGKKNIIHKINSSLDVNKLNEKYW
jgi:hypothetical protein